MESIVETDVKQLDRVLRRARLQIFRVVNREGLNFEVRLVNGRTGWTSPPIHRAATLADAAAWVLNLDRGLS